MKVKLFFASAGPGGNWLPSSIVEVDEETGLTLVESKQGERVPENSKVTPLRTPGEMEIT